MTLFDLFILAILGLSGVFAWIRGFTRELVTLVAIGFGVMACMFFGQSFSTLFGEGTFSQIAGYATLFLIVFIIAHIVLEIVLGRYLGKEPVRLDRIGGVIYGIIRGWLLLGLVYLALNIYFDEDNPPAWLENSLLKGPVVIAAEFFEGMGLQPLGTETEPEDGESPQNEPV
ncbi:CvpA family protein [Parvularcula marina]|uniref:CvpA family protein n=1 Tax=Parvularcula marina TaxID=2292771 RepID=UPI003513CC9F